METPSVPHVLILEDDRLDAAAWVRFLEDRGGFTTTVANTVFEATRALVREQFDALLLDHKLPDGEGVQLIAHLPDDRALGVVMLTGYQDAQLAVRALGGGAHGFLLKADVEPENLRSAITEAIGVAEQQHKRRKAAHRLGELVDELAHEMGRPEVLEELIEEARDLAAWLLLPVAERAPR